MPVILAEENPAKWLSETEDGDLKELLKPYPADEMKMAYFSQRVEQSEK
jgi:putative SOS response-associated peptidase YedK